MLEGILKIQTLVFEEYKISTMSITYNSVALIWDSKKREIP